MASRARWAQVWQFTRHWLWLLAITAMLGASASLLSALRQPSVYTATATIVIAPARAGSITSDELLAAGVIAYTYARLVSTHAVVQPAVDRAGLQDTPEHIAQLVSAEAIPDTQLLRVTARNDTPERAAELADAVAESLARQIQASVINPLTTREQQVQSQVDQLNGVVTEHMQRLTELNALPRTAETESEIGKVRAELSDAGQRSAAASQTLQDVRNAEVDGRMAASVAAAATGSSLPLQRQVLVDTLLGATVGLLVAAGVGYAVEKLDDRLLSAARLERITGVKVVGKVPVFEVSSAGQALDPAHAPEAFSVLWANLRPIVASNPSVRTLLITSTGANEGRTIAAAHLAVAAAQAGIEVILIDANLRRPALHTLFGVANNPGLTSLLMDQDLAVADVLLKTSVPRLLVLPSGPVPRDPGSWLTSRVMRMRLAELGSRANLVLIDSPPVLGASDAVVLAAVADGTLVVVDTQTGAGQATQALAALQKTGTRVVGTVLNRVTPTAEVHELEWRSLPVWTA